MKPRFEPDVVQGVSPTPAMLGDHEAYDASEQSFAASLEEKPAPPAPRFVVDRPVEGLSDSRTEDVPLQTAAGGRSIQPTEAAAPLASGQVELLAVPDSWRQEVAARVNNYRARRRPRSPRYPSLQLRFDPPESPWSAPAANPATATVVGPLAVALRDPISPSAVAETPPLHRATGTPSLQLNAREPSPRILEFPRSAAPPSAVFDELAEPMFDRPRILEAPEHLPPPPALGGILIEPVEQPAQERRPGFELPLQPAPMPLRLMAGAIDALLVASAFMAFAYIFFRITAIVPPLQQAAGISAVLIGIFWIAYQYLLLVYTGTTPGLKLAKLRLSRFDGNAVPRRIRRWRVLASVLSGLSLALGYAWCFLDEDELCWHDRITRTYMAPRATK